MSIHIDEWRIVAFSRHVVTLSQQRNSRLRNRVFDEGFVRGKRVGFDRVGATQMTQRTTRHMDTPLNNVPHSRRWAPIKDFVAAELVDEPDRLKTINDPTNHYARAFAMAHGRQIDDIIIDALVGDALEGEEATSTQVGLPASQVIPAGSTAMTIDKLRAAKRKLDEAEVDEMIPRHILVSAQQLEDLLKTTEVTSIDYNTVRALVQGNIDTFMGFNFVRSERLPKVGSDRQCIAWSEMGLGFGPQQELEIDIGPRRDKNNSIQVLATGGMGAVRLEDVQVVRVDCQEA